MSLWPEYGYWQRRMGVKGEQLTAALQPDEDMVVVLRPDLPGDIDLVGKAVKNCWIVYYQPVYNAWSEERDTAEPQLHVFPLSMWTAYEQWYTRDPAGKKDWNDLDKDEEKKGIPEIPHPRSAEVHVFINGAKVDLDGICGSCHFRLERTLGLCRPLHPACKGEMPQPLRIADLLTPEVFGRMDLDAMPQDLFRKPHQLCDKPAMHPVGFSELTSDAMRLGRYAVQRAEQAIVASATRTTQKYICKGCLQECKPDRTCHRFGGCKEGPRYEEDMYYAAELARPFMAHVAMLSGKRLDARPLVEMWTRDRIDKHTVICALEDQAEVLTAYYDPTAPGDPLDSTIAGLHTRKKKPEEIRDGVGMLKQLKRGTEMRLISYEQLCGALKVEPIRTWEEFNNRYEPLQPFVRATLHHLYSWELYRWNDASNVRLRDVGLYGNEVMLYYMEWDGNTRTEVISNWIDLYKRLSYDTHTFDNERKQENASIRRLIIDEKIKLSALNIRKLFAEGLTEQQIALYGRGVKRDTKRQRGGGALGETPEV